MSDSNPLEDSREIDTDTEELAPSVDIPEPDISEGGLDSDAATLFVRLVIVFNVALFGVTVGPMVHYFDGHPTIGNGLLFVGAIAGIYGLVRYWRFRRQRGRRDRQWDDR